MRNYDKNLMLRVARRLEDQADSEFTEAQRIEGDDPRLTAAQRITMIDEAKRRRDRLLGDAHDLRNYVKLNDVFDREGASVYLPTTPDEDVLKLLSDALRDGLPLDPDATARKVYDIVVGNK